MVVASAQTDRVKLVVVVVVLLGVADMCNHRASGKHLLTGRATAGESLFLSVTGVLVRDTQHIKSPSTHLLGRTSLGTGWLSAVEGGGGD